MLGVFEDTAPPPPGRPLYPGKMLLECVPAVRSSQGTK